MRMVRGRAVSEPLKFQGDVMDVKMYRSRKEQWCGSAGGRGEGEDELYTVMDFYIRTPQRVT